MPFSISVFGLVESGTGTSRGNKLNGVEHMEKNTKREKHNWNQIAYTCFSIKRSAPENSIETRVMKMAAFVQKFAATVINQNQKSLTDHGRLYAESI